MRLSQSALFQLCCASFLAGIFLSFFCDVLYMARLWLTPSQIRYDVLKIQQMRASRVKKGTTHKGKGLKVAIFFGDLLFSLVGALTLILLLYWLNNGAFRAVAPLCMALGFYLCHISLSMGIRIALQWVAFGIETVLYMLCFPVKRLFSLIVKKYKKGAENRRLRHLAKQRKIYTKQTLQNIEKATERLLPDYSKNRIQKGDNRARKSKKAI